MRGRAIPVDPQASTMERLAEDHELDEDLIRDERAHALREACWSCLPRVASCSRS